MKETSWIPGYNSSFTDYKNQKILSKGKDKKVHVQTFIDKNRKGSAALHVIQKDKGENRGGKNGKEVKLEGSVVSVVVAFIRPEPQL